MGFRRNAIAAVLGAAVLLAAQLATGSALAAPKVPAPRAPEVATSTPSLNVGSLAESPEYFTDNVGDPLDFSNPEDFDTSFRRSRWVATSLHDGLLDYTTLWGAGRMYFVDSSPTDLAVIGHRQSNNNPVLSWKYRRMSFNAYTDREIVAYLVFNHCADGSNAPHCEGLKAVVLKPGWHFYDLDMTGPNDRDSWTGPGIPSSVQGAPWTAGDIAQLSLQPSATGVSGVHGLISHVRLYEPGNLVVVSGSGGSLWWDLDADPGNNAQGGAGVLANVGAGSTAVDFGSLPPGNYRFETQSGSGFSPPSAPYLVDPAPRPVVINPDVAGDGDWFSEIRGNAMDFEDGGDVFPMFDGWPSYRNMNVGLAWGALHADSANPDPQLFLNDAWWNGAPIDANEWHRLTWRAAYDGGWGTNAVAGQGLDARFCWQALQGQPACTKDVFPALPYTTYSVALHTFPPAAVESPGYSGLGWSGLNHMFRFDPHEDPGGRGFHLDYVRLSHDDRVPHGGNFAIRFYDAAWEQGTVADVYIDGDAGGSLGALIYQGLGVVPGENSVPWSGQGFAPGIYNVNVVLRDPRGSVRVATSTGPVDLPDPGRWTPFGVLEGAMVSGRSIVVGGWAVDPDAVRAPVSIHVWVDGAGYDTGPAYNSHAGLAWLRKDLGADHGFLRAVPAEPGVHTVCTYAINIGYGDNTSLGCRQLVVK